MKTRELYFEAMGLVGQLHQRKLTKGQRTLYATKLFFLARYLLRKLKKMRRSRRSVSIKPPGLEEMLSEARYYK